MDHLIYTSSASEISKQEWNILKNGFFVVLGGLKTLMLQRPVWQKMGLKPGMRTYYSNAPTEAIVAIGALDVLVSYELKGLFDYINCFVITAAELHSQLKVLKPHLAAGGNLWVSWPKGRQLGSDLTVHGVERIVYQYNLVESTNLRIDDIWTSLKCTHPKPGKIYHNSYGTLPTQL